MKLFKMGNMSVLEIALTIVIFISIVLGLAHIVLRSPF